MMGDPRNEKNKNKTKNEKTKKRENEKTKKRKNFFYGIIR